MSATRIIIAAYKGKGIVSRAIAWFTRTYDGYSHIALVIPDGRHIEAWSNGVVVRNHFDDHGEPVDFFTVDATDEAVALMVAFAQQEVGCKYDWLGDFKFVTRMRGADDKRWFCSELAYAALAAGHVFLFRATQAWEVSPGMLVRSPLLLPIVNPIEITRTYQPT